VWSTPPFGFQSLSLATDGIQHDHDDWVFGIRDLRRQLANVVTTIVWQQRVHQWVLQAYYGRNEFTPSASSGKQSAVRATRLVNYEAQGMQRWPIPSDWGGVEGQAFTETCEHFGLFSP
jgi:hypothetical protein